MRRSDEAKEPFSILPSVRQRCVCWLSVCNWADGFSIGLLTLERGRDDYAASALGGRKDDKLSTNCSKGSENLDSRHSVTIWSSVSRIGYRRELSIKQRS